MRNTNNEHRASSIENAFSLIEVLIATILVGLAIVALIAANSSFTKANAAGTELSTAEFLIEQIRERTALVDYAGLYAFDGVSFSPPISAGGEVLSHFAAFSQQVTVVNVSASDFEQVVDDGSSDFIRVTVKVLLNSRQICSTSWIRADIDN
jgi:type II secretory pathway pseudopilin PulG